MAPVVATSVTSPTQEVAPDILAGKEIQPSKPAEIFRKDYKPTPYLVESLHLTFKLDEHHTRVISRLQCAPNKAAASGGTNGSTPEMFLNGRDDLKLLSVSVNGDKLKQDRYDVSPRGLTLRGLPAGSFELQTEVQIDPTANTSLEGLYYTGGNFCTQCEAEGFRGITYHYDRPDVMSTYTTRIEADKARYPVLLSNGNLMEQGELDGSRHYAVWEDPFKKPCYLFALVAGDLACHEDTFKTMSGRDVKLRIFVQHKNISKVDFAMRSLKHAMKWDEDTFGLEYDLDLFNIVAVDDFNMGAMENKSLNVFNSRLVLASPETATDLDFARIEGVVGHEYFHNWTGNRVTCRDWFQLTLKEGLTVFRDQEFSSDMNSRPVKRIEDVVRLRTAQFTEDNGPIAHPIRPDSYIKMDNFYTVTVYEKGAEIIRIYRTLLGRDGFRKGMDLYFKRHDGNAVTCDDFLAAMADANSTDLSSVSKWYAQAGTPQLKVTPSYDASARTYKLVVEQSVPPTPGQKSKTPVMIPLALGLLSSDGTEMPLHLQGSTEDLGTSTVLRVDQARQEFVFTEVPSQPVASLLRNFSAPVRLEVTGQTTDDLVFLLAHDTDPFNRWEAGQRLAKKLLVKLYHAATDAKQGKTLEDRVQAAGGVDEKLVKGLASVLQDESLDGAFVAAAMTLPATSEVIDLVPEADPLALFEVRKYVMRQLAAQLRPELQATVKRNDSKAGEPYSPDAKSAARRSLKNTSLAYLSKLAEPSVTEDLLQRFKGASNMTDRMAAMGALADVPGKQREAVLQEFYEQFKEDSLVVLKWLGVLSSSNVPGNLKAVRALLDHPAVNLSNPNTNYSLFLGFVRSPVNFHAADGSGYSFMGDMILKVDQINRQVASRMTSSAFTTWRQLDQERQGMMKQQLQRLVDTNGISDNVLEIAQKALQT